MVHSDNFLDNLFYEIQRNTETIKFAETYGNVYIGGKKGNKNIANFFQLFNYIFCHKVFILDKKK